MTDILCVNAYTILGVAEDYSSIAITAVYKRRLVDLQRKQTQPNEYALLLNSYRQLADPAVRTKIDQDLAEQRAERKIVVKQPARTKRRYDLSDPTVQYSRLMASAKASRTRTRTDTGRKYDRACREADEALRSGLISNIDRDAIAHLAKSAYQTKLDAIDAKFAASESAIAARFDQSSGTVQSHALEQTA